MTKTSNDAMAHPAIDPPRRRFFDFWRPIQERPVLAVCALLLVVSLVFLAAPQLDLAFSALFYDGAGFDEQRYPWMVFVRETGRNVEKAVAVGFLLPFLVKFLVPGGRMLVRPRASLFALAALAIGPGLIVNGILKEHWGRARPRALLEFGGDASFSPVWWISDQCDGNCSFVSGEASSAFWLLVLAFVVPKAWRTVTMISGLAFAAAISFTRIVAGGHFISDVLIAWLLTLLVMLALQRLVLQGLPPQFDATVEARIAAGGRAFRRLLGATQPPGSR